MPLAPIARSPPNLIICMFSNATTNEAAKFIKKGLMPISRILRKMYSFGDQAWRLKRIKVLGNTKCTAATTEVATIEMVVAHAAPAIPQPMILMKRASSAMLRMAPPAIIHMLFVG